MSGSEYRTAMRSHLCGTIDRDLIGKEVSLCGWVNKRRDHGKLIFIDLRDFSGIVQLVFDPASFKESYDAGKEIRNEFVITGCRDCKGKGKRRCKSGHTDRRDRGAYIINRDTCIIKDASIYA